MSRLDKLLEVFRDERLQLPSTGKSGKWGSALEGYLDEWVKWNGKIKTQLVRLQNEDGSWAGHHCITGRVAVTSAAILTVLVDQTLVETSNESTKS